MNNSIAKNYFTKDLLETNFLELPIHCLWRTGFSGNKRISSCLSDICGLDLAAELIEKGVDIEKSITKNYLKQIEEIIIAYQASYLSFRYSIFVIKKRFKAGEEFLRNHPEYQIYKSIFEDEMADEIAQESLIFNEDVGYLSV